MEIFIASSTKRVKAWFYRLALLFLLFFIGGLEEVYAQFYSSQVERVEHIGNFNPDVLNTKYGLVCFEASAQTRYGFDLGTEIGLSSI